MWTQHICMCTRVWLAGRRRQRGPNRRVVGRELPEVTYLLGCSPAGQSTGANLRSGDPGATQLTLACSRFTASLASFAAWNSTKHVEDDPGFLFDGQAFILCRMGEQRCGHSPRERHRPQPVVPWRPFRASFASDTPPVSHSRSHTHTWSLSHLEGVMGVRSFPMV